MKKLLFLPLICLFLGAVTVKTEADRTAAFASMINAYHEKNYEKAILLGVDYLRRFDDNFNIRYFLGLAFYMGGYESEAINQWNTLMKIHGANLELLNKIKSINYQNSIDFGNFKFPTEEYIYSQSFEKIETRSANNFLNEVDSDVYVRDGFVYVLDYYKGNLIKKDVRGKTVKTYRLQLQFPTSITPYENDVVVICDFGNNRLVFFDVKTETVVKTVGTRGIGEEKLKEPQFLGPYSVAVDAEKNLYVVDSGSSKIRYISRDGVLLNSFGEQGSSEGELFMPTFILLGNGNIYVSDTYNSRISIFSPKGNYIKSIGADFLERPKKFGFYPLNRDYFAVLDDKGMSYVDVQTGVRKNFFDRSVRRDKFEMLSYDIDLNGTLYVSDGVEKTVHLFIPVRFSYNNLFVNVGSINLERFPEVSIEFQIYNSMMTRPLEGLLKNHVKLFENGLEREFQFYERPPVGKNRKNIILLENSRDFSEHKEYVRFFFENYKEEMKEGDSYSLYAFGGDEDPADYVELLRDSRVPSYAQDQIGRLKGHAKFSVGRALKKAIGDLLHVRGEKNVYVLAFRDYKEAQFAPEEHHDLLRYAKNNMINVVFVYMGRDEQNPGDDFYYMKEFGSSRSVSSFLMFRDRSDMARLARLGQNYDQSYVLRYRSFENKYLSKDFRPVKLQVDYLGMRGEDSSGFIIP